MHNQFREGEPPHVHSSGGEASFDPARIYEYQCPACDTEHDGEADGLVAGLDGAGCHSRDEISVSCEVCGQRFDLRLTPEGLVVRG